MAYFYIGTTDYSSKVSSLQVQYIHNYTAQTNAAGNTVVDYRNKKRKVSVELIAMNDTDVSSILTAISGFEVNIKFLEPKAKALTEAVKCYLQDYSVSYYTIRQNATSFQKYKLVFVEL